MPVVSVWPYADTTQDPTLHTFTEAERERTGCQCTPDLLFKEYNRAERRARKLDYHSTVGLRHEDTCPAHIPGSMRVLTLQRTKEG